MHKNIYMYSKTLYEVKMPGVLYLTILTFDYNFHNFTPKIASKFILNFKEQVLIPVLINIS